MHPKLFFISPQKHTDIPMSNLDQTHVIWGMKSFNSFVFNRSFKSFVNRCIRTMQLFTITDVLQGTSDYCVFNLYINALFCYSEAWHLDGICKASKLWCPSWLFQCVPIELKCHQRSCHWGICVILRSEDKLWPTLDCFFKSFTK